MPLLTRASPAVLYPFLYLMPNGYFFAMAHYQAVLFNFDTGDEILLPEIPGKICRSYPWTGGNRFKSESIILSKTGLQRTYTPFASPLSLPNCCDTSRFRHRIFWLLTRLTSGPESQATGQITGP